MLAIKFHGMRQHQLKEIEIPSVMADSILLKVFHAPICGTDLAITEGKVSAKYGVTLGHEYYGLVNSVGKEVQAFRVNDRVIGSPSVPCLGCYYCRRGKTQLCIRSRMFGLEIDGSFAEYMVVPSPEKVLIKTDIESKAASLVGDTFATGYHSIEQVGLSENESIAILGAGPVGCATLMAALRRRPSNVYVIARSKYRLSVAEKLGGTILTANGAEEGVQRRVYEDTLVGVDAVVDCAGSQTTLNLAMKLAKKGGRIAITSVMPEGRLSMLDLMVNEKRIIGCFCPSGPRYLMKVEEFVRKNTLESELRSLISHEFTLSDGMAAMKVHGSSERMKILLNT